MDYLLEMQLEGMALTRIGRRLPLPEEPWFVDRGVELVTDKTGAPALRWRSVRELLKGRELPRVTEDPSVLDAFAALATATPERVLAFARKYGMLQLCKHGMRSLHDSRPSRVVVCGALNPEPVAVYTALAGEVQAILRLAARARSGRPGRPQDWDLLAGEPVPRDFQTAQHARSLVTLSIQRWFEDSGVRPRFTWDKQGQPEVRLGGAGVFGALALQLAFAVAHTDGLASCDGCGQFFMPKRIQGDRRSWCPNCGKRAADRASKRRERAYRRGGR